MSPYAATGGSFYGPTATAAPSKLYLGCLSGGLLAMNKTWAEGVSGMDDAMPHGEDLIVADGRRSNLYYAYMKGFIRKNRSR